MNQNNIYIYIYTSVDTCISMHGEVEQSKVEQSEVVPEPGISNSGFEQWFRAVIASTQGLRSKRELCFRAQV